MDSTTWVAGTNRRVESPAHTVVNGDTTLHQACALAAKRIQKLRMMVNAHVVQACTHNFQSE